MREERTDGGAVAIGAELADLATRLAVVAVAADGRRIGHIQRLRLERAPTPEQAVERLGELVARLTVALPAAISSVSSVGVAAWARVDPARGVIADTRFGATWEAFPLVERLAARLGAPTRLLSGVSAAARAEARQGAAVGRSPLLYIHLGRSVASTLVVDGVPIEGARFDAGRLGHWQTGLDGPRCVCGATGHLEPLVSAQSLVRLAIGMAADDEQALVAIHRVTGMRAEALTAPQVVTLARDGVRVIRELVDVAVDALAGALANLIVTLDPAAVVIGGPLAKADGVFLDWLRERLGARLAGVADPPDIAAAALEPDGAALGAIWRPEPSDGG